MKKFLLSAAAVAVAASMSAADALYVTGNFAASNWAPETPQELAFDGTNYTGTIEGVSMFKLSTVSGADVVEIVDETTGETKEVTGWDAFNTGCLVLAEGGQVGEGTYDLVSGDDNITLKWSSDWTVTVSGDLSTITLKAASAQTQAVIYLRGGMNGWGADDAWKFETADGDVYTLNGVVIPEGEEFKVGDDNWGSVNYGYDAGTMYLDEPAVLNFNSAKNITLDYEGAEVASVNCTFVLSTTTFTVSTGAGIEGIAADNAAAVYYNLQGVQVANPANGVFVCVKGGKAAKVLVK